MKVTLLGHASVLVETGSMRILMDPVLRDPFESGMVVSCPKREIHLERLPPIDVVVVSHRHPDHFDLSSLDLLPRACQVASSRSSCCRIARAMADPASLAARYRREGVVYELEVVFPDTARVWTLDFRAESLALREGRDPLANVAHRIAASACAPIRGASRASPASSARHGEPRSVRSLCPTC